MLTMAAFGELSKPDFAIHADTTWERRSTYEFAARWIGWLEEHDMRVETVRAENPQPVDEWGGVMLPAYTIDDDAGQLHRQCTGAWKIKPMKRYLRSQGATAKNPAELWIGISKDEWTRAKDSDVKYIAHRFPLLELGMTRADCITWLQRHGLEVPGKSSCTFCPFHSARAWQEMKRENGHDWQQAVEIDAAIRDKRPPYPLYLHRSCKPLPEAVTIPEDYGYEQLDMFVDLQDAACDSGACFL
jgi:hypothetical protein